MFLASIQELVLARVMFACNINSRLCSSVHPLVCHHSAPSVNLKYESLAPIKKHEGPPIKKISVAFF